MASRISKEQTDQGTLIKIKAFFREGKQKMLTLWLIAWTLCGIAVISQFFSNENEQFKIMILVFTAFWLYFEYLVVKAFRWRRSGEEQFLITEDEFHYGRTYNNRGFLRPYRKDLVNPARSIDEESNTFYKVFADSYWVIGGERLAFSANGKFIPFGLRLSDKEAKKLMKLINEELS